MPPVAMMAVVLPALRASRTSIHVISSIHTVFGVGTGLGASTQLYGLAAQRPPPRSCGEACCCCAEMADAAASMSPASVFLFIVLPREREQTVATRFSARKGSVRSTAAMYIEAPTITEE